MEAANAAFMSSGTTSDDGGTDAADAVRRWMSDKVAGSGYAQASRFPNLHPALTHMHVHVHVMCLHVTQAAQTSSEA